MGIQGDAEGFLNILDSETLMPNISFNRSIRIFDLSHFATVSVFSSPPTEAPQPLSVLQDEINRVSWISAVFSNDLKFVFAISHKHDMVFIWDILSAQMIKTLAPLPSKKIVDLCWHPFHPTLISV